MNIATAVFDTVFQAENALRALVTADYAPRDIYFVTQDRNKGEVLANDLKQLDISAGTGIPHAYGGIPVYDRLPEEHISTIRSSNLSEEAITWYRQELDRGRVLLVVNTGNRLDSAVTVLRANGGKFYGMERRAGTEGPTTRPEAPRQYTGTTDENIPPSEEGWHRAA